MVTDMSARICWITQAGYAAVGYAALLKAATLPDTLATPLSPRWPGRATIRRATATPQHCHCYVIGAIAERWRHYSGVDIRRAMALRQLLRPLRDGIEGYMSHCYDPKGRHLIAGYEYSRYATIKPYAADAMAHIR